MAKISLQAKKKYGDTIKEYKKIVNDIVEREKKIKLTLTADERGANYKKLAMTDENLNIVSYLLLMNNLSVSLLGVKNEAFLNDARKCIYKSIIYLEEIVSAYIDAPFSELDERLATIETFDDIERYKLVRKMGFAIYSVEDAFGKSSKWKWSFVELEGRYTTVLKNLMNFKTLIGKLNPNIPGYDERRAHLDLVLEMLRLTSARYREKYELSRHCASTTSRPASGTSTPCAASRSSSAKKRMWKSPSVRSTSGHRRWKPISRKKKPKKTTKPDSSRAVAPPVKKINHGWTRMDTDGHGWERRGERTVEKREEKINRG
jgi:hypothetical protein